MTYCSIIFIIYDNGFIKREIINYNFGIYYSLHRKALTRIRVLLYTCTPVQCTLYTRIRVFRLQLNS